VPKLSIDVLATCHPSSERTTGFRPGEPVELGRKLASLRERGVLIVARGNVVHNLRWMNWKLTGHGFDWAERFDQDAKDRVHTHPTEFATLDAHPDYGSAVPTPDHFIPALYLAGPAGTAQGGRTEVLVDG
jgi:4,5-DOPA dioxygenase extradiol